MLSQKMSNLNPAYRQNGPNFKSRKQTMQTKLTKRGGKNGLKRRQIVIGKNLNDMDKNNWVDSTDITIVGLSTVHW